MPNQLIRLENSCDPHTTDELSENSTSSFRAKCPNHPVCHNAMAFSPAHQPGSSAVCVDCEMVFGSALEIVLKDGSSTRVVERCNACNQAMKCKVKWEGCGHWFCNKCTRRLRLEVEEEDFHDPHHIIMSSQMIM
jgi:hypothetical protein